MELTLLPIAAILLLLSGGAGRVPAAQGASAPAALIRLWLTRESAEATSFGHAANRRSAGRMYADPSTPAAFLCMLASLAVSVRITGQALSRVLLHGRFRVRSIVFPATAPPVA